MDDKSGYDSTDEILDQRPLTHRASIFGRVFKFIVAAITIFGIWMLFMPAPQHNAGRNTAGASSGRFNLPNSRLPSHDEGSSTGQDTKILLETHIMSKCPDAQDCLRDLVVPAMEDVSDKVNFTISHISQSIDEDGSIECKHGISECMGNIIELCAASLYPEPKTHLGFTMCLTNDYKQIAEKAFVEGCALEHGIDLQKLDECAKGDDGAHGMALLQQSVARSASANITTSCTIRLNNETWCVRDGGKWKDCKEGSTPQDLVRDVMQAAGIEWQQ